MIVDKKIVKGANNKELEIFHVYDEEKTTKILTTTGLQENPLCVFSGTLSEAKDKQKMINRVVDAINSYDTVTP